MVRSKRKFNKTKEWLIEEYTNKNRSLEDIAKECGMHKGGLKSLLLDWKITRKKLILDEEYIKDKFESNVSITRIGEYFGCGEKPINRIIKKLGLIRDPIKADYDQYDSSNDELMVSMYYDGMSSNDIAKYFGITHRTVLNHLIRCNVSIRTWSESQWLYNGKIFPEDLKSYDMLYDLYINQRLSKQDLGLRYNCSPDVIDRVLKEFNIPIRGDSECKIGLRTGSRHHNWKGGITLLHMRLRQWFYNHQVPLIKERDHYTCQLCGCNHNLEVHHIIQFKDLLRQMLDENPHLDIIRDINELYEIGTKYPPLNNLSNLTTYCKNCHLFTIHQYSKK